MVVLQNKMKYYEFVNIFKKLYNQSISLCVYGVEWSYSEVVKNINSSSTSKSCVASGKSWNL